MSVPTAQPPFARRTARPARRSVVIVALIAALAAAGCSSKAGDTSGGPSGGGASTKAVVATATRLLDAAAKAAVTGPSFGPLSADQIVPWTASMMPKVVALPKGKKIKVDIVYGLAIGEGPYITSLTGQLAKKLGWTVKVIRASSQSQPDTLAAFQQAVNDKPTAIISFVVPGVWVGGALAAAKKAGIYTIDVHQDSSTGPGYDAWVPAAEGVQKSLMAAYAIKESNGSASTLLVDAPGFSDSDMPAAKAYLEACTGCTTDSGQFNPADLIDPVKLQSDVTSALAPHPGLDYVMWPSASLPLQPVTTAIRNSTSKDAKLLLNGIGPDPMSLVKSGAVPLLVQAPDVLLALTALDDVSRLVQGQPAIAETALRLPVSYWTPDTVPDVKSFADIAKAQLTNDWLTPYEKAWGISLRGTVLAAQ